MGNFFELVYQLVVAFHSWHSCRSIKKDKLEEMDEVYLHLSRSTSPGKSDISSWRLAPFEDVCANNAVLGDNGVEINMDSVSANYPGPHAFRALQNLKVSL